MFTGAFETEERNFRNRKTGIAAAVTILLHALILLFLIWFILSPPNPPYTDSGGVSVNFGNSEVGSGDVQSMTLTPIQANFTPAPAANAAHQKAELKENIATQDLEDAPMMKSDKTAKPERKPDENAMFKPNTKANPNKQKTNSKTEETTPPELKPDPNAMFSKGAYGVPNKSKGDGDGRGQGDQGKSNGDPNSKNYLGDGEGTGSGHGHGDLNGGYNLNGRKKISLPSPLQCNSKGKVVIEIKVDRSGKVVEANFKRFASTVFDECNVSNALTAARKSTFNADSNAPETQSGTITYIYKVD